MDRTYPEALSISVFNEISRLRKGGYSTVPTLFAQQMHRMGVIMPDIYERGRGEAGLLLTPRHAVGRYSGSKLTTAFNSIGHAAAHMIAFEKAGLTSDNDPNRFREKVIIRIQGDDVIMVRRDECPIREYDRYLGILPAVMRDFGFETEVFPGNTFLMRHYDGNGNDHPVLSRVLQQTVSPEHQKTDPRVQLIGQAARTSGWEGIPPELKAMQTDVEEVIREYSPALFDITLLDDRSKHELIVELGTDIAKSEKGKRQLTDLIIDNRFSRSGIELLDSIVGTDLEDIVNDEFARSRRCLLYTSPSPRD